MGHMLCMSMCALWSSCDPSGFTHNAAHGMVAWYYSEYSVYIHSDIVRMVPSYGHGHAHTPWRGSAELPKTFATSFSASPISRGWSCATAWMVPMTLAPKKEPLRLRWPLGEPERWKVGEPAGLVPAELEPLRRRSRSVKDELVAAGAGAGAATLIISRAFRSCSSIVALSEAISREREAIWACRELTCASRLDRADLSAPMRVSILSCAPGT